MIRPIDLTDYLNPVVVKEVRQGLKSRRFLTVFLLLIMGMTAGMSVALLPQQVSDVREISTGVFWSIASACFLALMPLLGVNALSSEKKEQTFELVMLTRVTSWRLVFGKWASLVVQTLLVATTLLPYLVVRHYIGGIDVASELVILFLMLIASAAMSAFAVFISSFESWLVKLGLIGAQLWGMGGLIAVGVTDLTRGSTSVGWSDHVLTGLAGIAGVAALVAFVLEVAASRLAPISENHAVRKRGLAIAVMFVACVLSLFDPNAVAAAFGCMFLYAATLDACVERFAPTPTVYAPFVRYGALGRAAGFLFYPGPVSATYFSCLTSVVIPVTLVIAFDFDASQALTVAVTTASTLLVPLAFARLLSKRVTRASLVFVAFHASMGMIAAVGQAIREIIAGSGIDVPTIVPSTALIAAVIREGDDLEMFLAIVVNGPLAALALLYLIVGRSADWAAIAAQEKRAAELLRSEAPPR